MIINIAITIVTVIEARKCTKYTDAAGHSYKHIDGMQSSKQHHHVAYCIHTWTDHYSEAGLLMITAGCLATLHGST